MTAIGVENTYGQIRTDEKTKQTKIGTLINGVDPNSIANELVAVKNQQSDQYKDKITLNSDKKIPVIETLRQKLETLDGSLKKLTNNLQSNFLGSNSLYPNALGARIERPKQADGAINITMNSMAKVSTSDEIISVSQVASKDRITSGFKFPSNNSPVDYSGNLVINDQTIAISNNSTLNSIINDINSLTNLTHVTASQIKISDTAGYVLILESNNIAEPINFDGMPGTSENILSSEGLNLTQTSTLDPAALDHVVSGYTNTSADAGFGFSGTLSINNQSITISPDSSLNSIRDAINCLKESNVVASVTSTDGVNFALTLDGTQAGVPINFMGIPGTSDTLRVDQGLKIPATNTDRDSLIAKLTINGTDIERSNNLISDVIPGVTITVNTVSTKDASSNIRPTIFSIDYDKDKAFAAIKEFVENYNLVIDALDEQKKMSADKRTPDPSAVLFGETILNSVEFLLRGVTNSANLGPQSGSGSSIPDPKNKDYTSLLDIGIKLNSFNSDKKEANTNGKLNINDEIFKERMLDGDFDKIIKLFGNYAQFVDSNFHAYKMPDELNKDIAGRPITLSYAYNGVTAADDAFSTNFNVPEPLKPLGAFAAGQPVTLTYTQNGDGTYSATIACNNTIKNDKGDIINGTATAQISNNQFSFPDGSIYAGLVINSTGTLPTYGSNITSTFTLPQFTATLSMPGQTDVVINNVQHKLINAPKDSIYAGLQIGYFAPGDTSPLTIGQSMKTSFTLTQGVAVSFDQALSYATSKYAPKDNSKDRKVTGIFDIAIQRLLDENTSNEKRIEEITRDAQLILQKWEPKMQKLFEASHRSKSISLMLEAQMASLKG